MQPTSAGTSPEELSLSYEEQNALRYAAGYIPRALTKKLRTSSHPLKDQLTLCLIDLTDDADDISSDSQDWINLTDRGGLKHVNDPTYMFFHSVEMMVQRCFQVPLPENFKEEIKSRILKDEDVLFYWSLVSADWEDGESEALLMMIIDMWITICGFSFASAWIEKYKLANKVCSEVKGCKEATRSSSY